MKVGKYIIEILSKKISDVHLMLPYSNTIFYTTKDMNDDWNEWSSKRCKHIKPGTGIRYKIVGFYNRILIIKQLN